MTTDTLDVTVNNKSYTVPQSIETLSEFLKAVGYDDREYSAYRIDGGKEIEITGDLFVFDGGDEFVIIPKYVDDG